MKIYMMKHKINLIFFIKIFAFVLPLGTCHIYNDSKLNKYLEGSYIFGGELNTRIHPVLTKYKNNKESSVVGTKVELPYIGLNNKEDICNYEKEVNGKVSESNKSTLNNEKSHKRHVKNKSWIFVTKKYSLVEKKVFKELDYIDFLKNNRNISHKVYKKIMRRKLGFRLALPLIFFFLLSLSLMLDFSCNCGLTRGLYKLLRLLLSSSQLCDFHNYLKDNVGSFFSYTVSKDNGESVYLHITPFFDFLIYCVLFFTLGITIISGIIYYHKKVKKYEKIKFRKT
ncbi:fam-l protein [Plasmodium malariae]|uniref:Fam-l protein n=2 Tax=Plasmodium (Plasmodium) TaxID=418103 RepID=A0A1D3JHY0_PLAMA|nr:fam-l protein [Plasmodium malariae]SBT86034.1 fam-l protein [Plasmodium malariae]